MATSFIVIPVVSMIFSASPSFSSLTMSWHLNALTLESKFLRSDTVYRGCRLHLTYRLRIRRPGTISGLRSLQLKDL